MKKSILILLVVLMSCHGESNLPDSENFDLIKMADGVYALIHTIGGKAICNAGIIDTGDETIIFDSFLSPEVAKEISDLVKKLHLSPIQYIVNSHWHNDHIRGNQIFSKEIDIVSTRKTVDLIKTNEPKQIMAEKNYAPKQLAYWDSLRYNYKGAHTDREYQTILLRQPYYAALVESHAILETRIPNNLVDRENNKGLKTSCKIDMLWEGSHRK